MATPAEKLDPATQKYIDDVTSYVRRLSKEQQLEFIILVSNYIYLIDEGHKGLTFENAREHVKKYDSHQLQRSNGVVLPVKEAFQDIRNKWPTRSDQDTYLHSKVRRLSEYKEKVPLATIKTTLSAVAAAANAAKRAKNTVAAAAAALAAKKPKATVAAKTTTWDPFGVNAAAAAENEATIQGLIASGISRNNATKVVEDYRAIKGESKKPLEMPASGPPFTGLSRSQVAACRTVEGLDEYIASLYPADQASGYKLIDGHQNIKRIITKCADPFVNGWKNINSDGHKYDCLIHSFLTATCDSFRKLTLPHKKVVADVFRRTFLPTLPEFTDSLTLEEQDAMRREYVFLGDPHALFITQIYKVSFLSLEGFDPRNLGATRIGTGTYGRTYIILNPNNAHYESVQPRPGDMRDFSITDAQAEAARICISPEKEEAAAAARGIADRICMPTGTPVRYEGRDYVVFEGIVNVETVTDKKGNPLYDANGRERQIRECSGYLLSTPENLAAYKGLADRVNNGTGRRLIDKIETRIKLRYCIPANKNGEKAVYIPPRLLQFGAAAAVAGPRAANAAALAAAGLPVRGAAAAVSEAGRNANAAAAAAAAASTTNANETILPTEYNRNTYVGLMTTMPDIEAAIARQELTYEDAKRMYEEEWNDAKVKQNASNAEFARSLAASRGGSRRTHRSRSLRAKRRHTSKAKGHGRRHHSRKH